MGLGVVARQALVNLMANLNDYIAEYEEAWHDPDRELASLRGQRYRPIEVERVDLSNFFDGHRPSILSFPIERFPNVSVMADLSRGDNESQAADQWSVNSVSLWVEVFTASPRYKGPEGGEERIWSEEVVNRRTERTLDAAVTTLLSDRTLGSLTSEIGATPSSRLGNVQATRLKERERRGDPWLFQGARIDWAVKKDAELPGTGSGHTLLPELAIDQ